MTSKKIPYASGGYQAKRSFGMVEKLFDDLLQEQAEWVKGMEIKAAPSSLDDLPPKTEQQKLDMAWDDSLEMQFSA